jgi:hypothetical protein
VTDASFTILDDGVPREVPARIEQDRVRLLAEQEDLAAHAARLGRPLAVDVEERAAYLGVPAEVRGRALASLDAPDFALPDLGGRVHRLSEHRGRKVFLIAYGSW